MASPRVSTFEVGVVFRVSASSELERPDSVSRVVRGRSLWGKGRRLIAQPPSRRKRTPGMFPSCCRILEENQFPAQDWVWEVRAGLGSALAQGLSEGAGGLQGAEFVKTANRLIANHHQWHGMVARQNRVGELAPIWVPVQADLFEFDPQAGEQIRCHDAERAAASAIHLDRLAAIGHGFEAWSSGVWQAGADLAGWQVVDVQPSRSSGA